MEELKEDHSDNEQDIEMNAFVGDDDNHQMDHRPRKKNKTRATLAKVIGGALLFGSGVFVGAKVPFDFAANKKSRKILQYPIVSTKWMDKSGMIYNIEIVDKFNGKHKYSLEIVDVTGYYYIGDVDVDNKKFSFRNNYIKKPEQKCSGEMGTAPIQGGEVKTIRWTCLNGEKHLWKNIPKQWLEK